MQQRPQSALNYPAQQDTLRQSHKLEAYHHTHTSPKFYHPWYTQTSATPRPQTPTPPSQFIIRVAELSRVKAQERQWGPVLDPIQCSRRTGLGPESSDYIPHNERPGSAGSAALSLALSHTHTDRPTAALLLKSWSVLFFSLVTTLTFASAAALHIAVWPREPRGLDASLLCVCVLDGEQVWPLFPRVNSHLKVWAKYKLWPEGMESTKTHHKCRTLNWGNTYVYLECIMDIEIITVIRIHSQWP